MDIPNDLQMALENEIQNIPIKKLAKYVSILSDRYRNVELSKSSKSINNMFEALAYAIYRMPATYSVIYSILDEVKSRYPDFKPQSLLDIGAGTGSATWASSFIWPNIDKITLVETNKNMLDLGKILMSYSPSKSLQNANWVKADINGSNDISKHDLVIASYVLNEMPNKNREDFLMNIWKYAKDILLIIEPGTPSGYSNIINARRFLIDNGAHIISPCPHEDVCPTNDNDWCHFSIRINRTKIHRQAKNSMLSYEDEKYSYICVSKLKRSNIRDRILRHPKIHSGHISIKTCTIDGIKDITITKKESELYKKVRKVKWGSYFLS